MGKIRGTNSSPGIYTQITDLQYSADSLGITTLGLVGETLKGPAFEPIAISNWTQFQDYFGGTSTETFTGSKYPKYELPYIAKSYLSASDQLYVCRVLGLSGYNAGPAFVLKQDNKVIGVLRSKISGYANEKNEDECNPAVGDHPLFKVAHITVNTHEPTEDEMSGCNDNTTDAVDNRIVDITCYSDKDGAEKVDSFTVSLVYGAKNYIYDVLGTSATSGSHPIYVESLYDAIIDEKTQVVVSEVDTDEISNYKEMFRHAVTPWFVSEVKGSEVKKLFRLHTITDGDAANSQVKITISNIKPDEGTFDLLVRDFADTDAQQVVLESYKNVNLVPGNAKYLGLKMGTINGDYPINSKYVIAEILEDEEIENSVPCGFLGYPIHQIEGIEAPGMNYNAGYNKNVRPSRQCFGLSNLGKGIDVDMLFYKGLSAYEIGATTTNGFHLDLRASKEEGVSVDGEKLCSFTTVADGIISSESEMKNKKSIYAEEPKLRKFTCCPYGGFDGWDIHRTERTHGNDFKSNKYEGTYYSADTVNGAIESLALPTGFNSSDYYAYLAGAMQFSNPDRISINLFATPGIDIVNNTSLVSEIVEMVDERKDTFYVITTPDKEKGASESVDEMYTPSEITSEVEDSGIDTYYASTYYPWVRYYDSSVARYISLPVTKDVVRNMADVDNKKYPWYAPAGIERGNVECNKARIFTKLNDENTIYDGRINPVKTFSVDGVKIWGNKTLYTGDTPMNRINTVRLVLYMRKLINQSITSLIFEPNDTTLKAQFEGIVKPILQQIKDDRGITDFRLVVSQTPEQMDEHEISAQLWIKPTPTLEYIELDFIVTPQGVDWNE